MTEEPRYGDYRDWLRKNSKTRRWKFEPTPKQAGDVIVTSTGVEKQP